MAANFPSRRRASRGLAAQCSLVRSRCGGSEAALSFAEHSKPRGARASRGSLLVGAWLHLLVAGVVKRLGSTPVPAAAGWGCGWTGQHKDFSRGPVPRAISCSPAPSPSWPCSLPLLSWCFPATLRLCPVLGQRICSVGKPLGPDTSALNGNSKKYLRTGEMSNTRTGALEARDF